MNQPRTTAIQPINRSSRHHWLVFMTLLMALILAGAGVVCAETTPFAEDLAQINQLLSAGKFDEALQTAQRIALEAETAGESKALATALLGESDAYYYLGQHEETLPPLERALTIYQSIDDLSGVGRVLYSIAYYYERSDSNTMISYLERAQKYAEQAADQKLQMNILNAMGNAHWNLGRYDQALAAYNASAELASELGDVAAGAASHQNIGMIHVHLGENRKALEYLELALEELTVAERPHGIAVVLGNAGNANLGLRDYEAALGCYERSLALHRENGYRRGEGIQLGNISSIHQLMNEPEKALELEQQAHAIAIETGDARSVIRTRSSLGRIQTVLGNIEEAEGYQRLAVQEAEAYGDPYLLVGPEKGLAQLAIARGDTSDAFFWADRAEAHAREVNDSYTTATIMAGRAMLHAKAGRLQLAIEEYEGAIVLHEQTHSRTDRHNWHAELAQLHLRRGDDEAARLQFELSLAEIADLDALIALDRFRVHLFDEVAGIISNYAAWLGQKGETRKGLEVLDWGRARELTWRMLQETPLSGFSAEELAALDKLSVFQRRIREEDLDEEERLAITAGINQAEAEYDRARRAGRGVSASREKTPLAVLPATTMAIEYAIHEDTLLVFSSYQNQTSFRQVAGASELMTRVMAFRSLVANPASGLSYEKAGDHLFETLLAGELLNGLPEELVLVPCHQLWALPFSALTTGNQSVLGDETVISFAPSLTSLAVLKEGHSTFGEGILALAKGEFSETETSAAPLARLEAVTQEAMRVGDLSRAATVMLETDEAQFKNMPLNDYQLIHWATHTLVDVEHPARSSIVVGASGSEDGYLQVREIYRLPLTARLVVVSGCSSGSGQVVAGEGLLGLSHALLSAGAKSTLLSRWNVSDEAAAVFMGEFYQEARHHTVAKALQLTRQKLRQSPQWNHPAIWSAFFVAGDGGQQIELESGSLFQNLWVQGGALLVVLLGLVLGYRRKSRPS